MDDGLKALTCVRLARALLDCNSVNEPAWTDNRGAIYSPLYVAFRAAVEGTFVDPDWHERYLFDNAYSGDPEGILQNMRDAYQAAHS